MSRPLRLFTATSLALLLLIGICLGIVSALLGSEAGLRFIAGQVEARAGDAVQWSRLEGSLLGPLRLVGLRVSLPGLALSADELQLSWQPGALLAGTARVETLEGAGIRLALTSTESDADASPFHPEDISLPMALELGDIVFSDLQITQDGQAPVQIDSIALSAQLAEGQLALRRLTVRLPQGGVTATAHAELASRMPLDLELSWDWLLPLPDEPADTASGGDRTVQFRGDLGLGGEIQWRERIDFELRYRSRAEGIQAFNSDLPSQIAASGELSGARGGDEFTLHRASLALDDTPLSLSLAGEVTSPGAPDARANVTLEWRGLRWPLHREEADIASDEGSLGVEGNIADYRLALTAALAGRDIPASAWTLAGNGDATGLTVGQLSGQILGGQLAVGGELRWDPAPRWELQLTGSGLDPGTWRPELPGSLTLALSTTGAIAPDTGLQTDVLLEEISGELLDYSLQGNGQVKIAGEAVQIVSLNLDSGGNALSASGDVSANTLSVDWQLTAGNPASLFPGAAGELSAIGTVTGSPEAPRLQAQVTGEKLAWETYSLPTLGMRLSAGPGADDPLELELNTDQVLDGGTELLASLQVQATGTTAQHRLQLAAATGAEQLRARLEGGLDELHSTWQGELTGLSLDSADYGQWGLANPTALSLSADRASLGDSCLQATGGTGRGCVLGQWNAGGDSEVQGRLQALPLERFVPTVTGAVDGELRATLAAGGALRVDSAITLGGGEVKLEDQRQLAHGGGDLQLQVSNAGLLAQLKLDAPEQGRLQATVTLPALNALPLADEQPLAGTISAALPDLSGFAAWVPELGSSAGRLSADMQLGGSLAEPRVEGSLALREGAATVPMAGLKLDSIELLATSDPADPGRLTVSGGMRSGQGQLDLSGDMDLANNTFLLDLGGDRFRVYDTPDARVLLSPDLQIAWRDNSLNLRGELTIPEAAITPKIQLGPAAPGQGSAQEEIPGQVIAPSPDVVVVSGTLETGSDVPLPDAPFRIDSRIRVVMGEDVHVKAVVFVSRITGAVEFTNTPEQEDLVPVASGRFSLEEGTFRAFGQDLEIETGHLIFADVPATEPVLNLRAVRWIDNDTQVTAAGVLVTGPVSQPVLELFSRRQLEASEIQSYLLTGRSPRSRENVLGIGTYLSRRIYVGYGYNMLEKTSEFNSLFNISPRFGLGSSVGEADNNINMTITYEH